MVSDREVIVVAGVGDLGRYVCEELQASSEFEVVVLTRGVSKLDSKSLRPTKRNPSSLESNRVLYD